MQPAATAKADNSPAGGGGIINIAGLVGDSIVDGPGLRFAVFSQGCTHRCPGCHNPATQPFAGGTAMPVQDIYLAAKKYPLCRGITFSGGEPFQQAGGFLALAKLFKPDGYELAAYSGYTFKELLNGTEEQQQLLSLLDVLVDGPFVQAEKNLNLRFRGSENQRILNVPQSLQRKMPVFVNKSRWQGE